MEKNKKWGFFLTCTVYEVKTDFVGQVYIVRTKKHDKNQEPMGMNLCSFSAAQDFCSKLENQANCYLAVFVTNLLKTHF